MSICITHAGEALFSSLQAQGLPLVIDTMIFANVPGLDPALAADRAQAVPTAHVVHSAAIPPEFRAYVTPNQVVYSVLLGSDVGNFAFNWQGLYCSEHQTLIAVVELPAIEKRANDAGTNTPGNNLTRNFMLQFTGAQALTGLTVEAEVWQLDFTVRLKGIDERERLSNRDIYGRAAFLDEGWLLVNNAASFHFEPGPGYVEGIRAALASQLPAVPAPLPCDVYLDVCLAPQGSDVVTLVTPRFVAPDAGLPDYAEGAPFRTKHHCVQVAHVAEDGTVTDLRPRSVPLVDDSLGSHNHDPAAHPGLIVPNATETVAGIVELASTAEDVAGTASDRATTPAGLKAAIAANASKDLAIMNAILLWRSMAKASGGFPGGYLFTFQSNELTSVTNGVWNSAKRGYSNYAGTTQFLGDGIFYNNMHTGYTSISRRDVLPAGKVVTKLGHYSAAAASLKLKILRRDSAGNYTTVVDLSCAHAGGGWQDFALATPYAVPADGFSYYLGVYGASAYALSTPTGSNAVVTGDITAASAYTEYDGQHLPMIRAWYGAVANMVLNTNAIAVGSVPNALRVLFNMRVVDVSILFTDLKFRCSRDGGATWTAYKSPTLLCHWDAGYTHLHGLDFDLSALAPGTSIIVELSTYNLKEMCALAIAAVPK